MSRNLDINQIFFQSAQGVFCLSNLNLQLFSFSVSHNDTKR